ncbi:hypothetical protein L208DRAFT_1346872 [Tricholoma matsutake]|nr:hypothetical protein L208DRAFT_1346872 [Tricholoma matsutake 945]
MVKIAALSRIDMAYGMHLKYLWYNLWSSEEDANFGSSSPPPCLADWTKHAEPLPAIPEKELTNAEAMKTIKENPDLFKIVTPIRVDHFEDLLRTHPNCPFVESHHHQGLREGFWPWVDMQYDTYPSIVDESLGMPQKKEEIDFLQKQQDHEHLKGRFSGSFSRDLLPGMHASPIHAVLKPHSEKLRMVINQSAGKYALNSMIRHEDVRGFPLDNMRHLGKGLLAQH